MDERTVLIANKKAVKQDNIHSSDSLNQTHRLLPEVLKNQ